MKMPSLIWHMVKRNFEMCIVRCVFGQISCLAHRRLPLRQNQDEDDEPSVFQRRATKPMLLWTTTKPADKLISDFETMKQPENVFGPPELIDAKLMAERANPDEDSKATKTNKQTQRHRSGMSLQEYLERSKAQH